MANSLRTFVLVALGFAAGVGVTLLLRREPGLPKTPPQRDSTTLSELKDTPAAPEEAIPTPSDTPSRPVAPPPPPKPADSAREDHALKNPRGVKFGRPENPDLEPILKAASWEKFYQMCKESKVRGATYEDLILRRLSQELGLDEEKSAALKKLFKDEQSAGTKAIIDSCGGAAGFERKKDDMGQNSKVIYDEWRLRRDEVRRSRDADYLMILTYDQLGSVNEHLRNSEIGIESSYDSDGVHYLLSGVGKPPK
jgi:hypothetical protein